MPDDFDFEDRLNTLEGVMRRLAHLLAEQREINHRFDGYIQEQRVLNAQQIEINAHQRDINQQVATTLARVETLLARMIPTGENGREA